MYDIGCRIYDDKECNNRPLTPDPRHLIMTYNIRLGHGIDGIKSIARIADVIGSSGAHIACLQEVGRKWPGARFADQPKSLGRLLNMEYAYQPNLHVGPAGFGNLILSKYPITKTISHPLTSVREQRGLLEAEIVTTEGRITVFCTHWGLDAEERLTQASETAEIVLNASSPIILCGDLNDTENFPPLMRLLSTSGLHDLARAAGNTQPTFPSNEPRIRIDYILGTSDIQVINSTTINSPASDHLPVLVEIGVRRKVMGVGC